MPIFNSPEEMMAARLEKMQAAQQAPKPKKSKPVKRNQPARSAAQVAMSKTNPAEPEEVYSPMFKQLAGAIGSVCVNCQRPEAAHFDGFCNPDDAAAAAAERELAEDQEAQNAADVADSFPEQPSDPGPISGDNTDYFPRLTPLTGSSLVDQALEIINLLPDCQEREMLLRRCAVAVSYQLQIIGYATQEEQQ